MQTFDCTKPIAICLMGPTACGKTDLAIDLISHVNAEIINVDSAQIYQGMDIGSGKPDPMLTKQIPHHLMDFLSPSISYSAAQFRHDAIACMQAIHERGKTPLLVGGTMLYFKILQEGMSMLPDANPAVRESIDQQAKQMGWAALHQKLAGADPVTAMRIKSTDCQRIQRALEILEITGKPMSYWLAQPKNERPAPYQFLNIALLPMSTPRSFLHERISQRFDAMLSQGLVTEVEKLMQRGDLQESLPSIRAVGYRQVWQYLLGKITYEEMREKAIAATRQLAKRQLTWLRRWIALHQFDFRDPALVAKVRLLLQEEGLQTIS